MEFYHGTALESATRLSVGHPLDIAAAFALKIDGPPGFYLATELADAEFFAVRRAQGAVIAYDVLTDARDELLRAGATYQPIPRSDSSPWFAGHELFIPPVAFAAFNRLLRTGRIVIKPV